MYSHKMSGSKDPATFLNLELAVVGSHNYLLKNAILSSKCFEAQMYFSTLFVIFDCWIKILLTLLKRSNFVFISIQQKSIRTVVCMYSNISRDKVEHKLIHDSMTFQGKKINEHLKIYEFL